jgi:hypothetical protein
MEAVMNILRSVAEHGLVAMPPMVDTSHLHVSDRRLVVPDGTADPSHLAWLQRGAVERSVARDELARIRRELRVMVLARAMATAPKCSEIVDGLKRQAKAMPLWYLCLLAILAPLAMVGSATWIIADASIVKHLLGLAGLGLFGTITMQAIYGLRDRMAPTTARCL